VKRCLLGRTGLDISRIGIGTWAMSGPGWNQGWGRQDDEVSIQTIHRAIDLGINWIDTAATYGVGHSEEVVGKAIRRLPASDRPLVFTKCGVIRQPGDLTSSPVRTLAPDSIRAEVEASLRRLGIDHIDVLQFHFPDEQGTPLEDSWGTMQRLIEEGKVRASGLSNFPLPLVERCEAIAPVGCIQPGLSLIHREALEVELPWAAANNVGAIVFSPLRSGLLTDSFSAAEVDTFDEGDWRRRHPDFNPPGLDRNLNLRDALRPIASRHSTTVSAVAIAWALSQNGVTGAIAGARAPDEIVAWIGAAELDLEDVDGADIDTAIRASHSGEVRDQD
jgi:aryl-alcohol dehydrogenase-like predicted oxidoreductase